jgi:hypothetical protein
MNKAIALVVAGLITSAAFATSASAGTVFVSKTRFTTFDGQVCTVITKRVRNDFGDLRQMSVRRCGFQFAAF